MIAVDTENGKIDTVVFVFVIDDVGSKIAVRVAEDLDFDGIVAHGVFANDFHGLVEGSSRGFVVMEEIAAQENHVDFVEFGQVQDFLKGSKGI